MGETEQVNKILVVEDSELLQKGYDLIFRRYRRGGCTLVRASNGKEGLERLIEHPDCDLIILDINMPEMSGLEFLRLCRSQRPFQKIPVIIISTEGEDEDIMRGLKAGANAYLKKPFQVDELHSMISTVLGGSPRRRAALA